MVDTSTSRLHAAMYSRLASREELHRGHPRPHRDVQAPPRLLRHLREELLSFSRCALARGATGHQPRGHAVQYLASRQNARSGKHRAAAPRPFRFRWGAFRSTSDMRTLPVDSPAGEARAVRPQWSSKSWKRRALLPSLLPRTGLCAHTRTRTSLFSGRGVYFSPSAPTPAPQHPHTTINGHAHPRSHAGAELRGAAGPPTRTRGADVGPEVGVGAWRMAWQCWRSSSRPSAHPSPAPAPAPTSSRARRERQSIPSPSPPPPAPAPPPVPPAPPALASARHAARSRLSLSSSPSGSSSSTAPHAPPPHLPHPPPSRSPSPRLRSRYKQPQHLSVGAAPRSGWASGDLRRVTTAHAGSGRCGARWVCERGSRCKLRWGELEAGGGGRSDGRTAPEDTKKEQRRAGIGKEGRRRQRSWRCAPRRALLQTKERIEYNNEEGVKNRGLLSRPIAPLSRHLARLTIT